MNDLKTFSAKPTDVTRVWYVLDASEAPLGRLSTVAAKLLIGKDKPIFTKHIDCGDFVIVINSDKVVLTGQKADQKQYYRHSGYPGGLTEISFKEQLAKDSTQIVKNSIRGMLPVNKLRSDRLLRLKVYTSTDHQHDAQKPISVSLKGNTK